MFENLLGQNEILHTLKSDLEADRLPPAILFSGPPGSGKITAALELARVLSCTTNKAGRPVGAQTTKTVGGTGANYATLKLAFDAINTGTITGAITLQITGSTTETVSAVLNASGSGSANYSSVSIYPTLTGKTISGNIAGPLIDLNGADYVVFDGRVNAAGAVKDLTITNTNTGYASSTVRLIGSAANNTLKYCTIKGSGMSSSAGIIFFSSAATGSGNDGNLVDQNNITADAAGRPVNAVYSEGTASRENSENTISNNNIYNFLNNSTDYVCAPLSLCIWRFNQHWCARWLCTTPDAWHLCADRCIYARRHSIWPCRRHEEGPH